MKMEWAGVVAIAALAIVPSAQGGAVNKLGRTLGVGWSAGYHARNGCSPPDISGCRSRVSPAFIHQESMAVAPGSTHSIGPAAIPLAPGGQAAPSSSSTVKPRSPGGKTEQVPARKSGELPEPQAKPSDSDAKPPIPKERSSAGDDRTAGPDARLRRLFSTGR